MQFTRARSAVVHRRRFRIRREKMEAISRLRVTIFRADSKKTDYANAEKGFLREIEDRTRYFGS